MLITEKPGAVWLVTQQGAKTPVENVPAVLRQGQGGMLGVFCRPHYASDHNVYLTYAEPGDGGSSLALARARLAIGEKRGKPGGPGSVWRQMPKGKGGQFGAPIAFSPDGQCWQLTGRQARRGHDTRPGPGPGAGQDGCA